MADEGPKMQPVLMTRVFWLDYWKIFNHTSFFALLSKCGFMTAQVFMKYHFAQA